jgi:pantoate ligase/cytidylate kinase
MCHVGASRVMELFTTTRELVHWRRHCRSPVHFVPTMGALHGAHQRLILRAARPSGDVVASVVVSVFVNPLQFGPGEDFQRYPRELHADAAMAEQSGATVLFAPGVEEMFPGGTGQDVFSLRVPDSLSTVLCGRSRPGHFDGVATIVARLLSLVRPDRLFLGEKDWQQLVILRSMVEAMGMPLAVEGCATVRDSDGLAASTRNRYLNPSERERARALPQALAAARSVHANGRFTPDDLVRTTWDVLTAAGLGVDYVELVDPCRLRPQTTAQGPAMLAAAVQCGPARLIDHTFLMTRAPIVAIDGPAGAGKSTVTRALAARLGLIHLDTGAMYRALTWWVQQQGADPADPAAVEPLLKGLDLNLSAADGQDLQIHVNGHNVTAAIRSPEVTAQVSLVAAHPCVREVLTRQQQDMGVRGGLVAEGRDIGTAVYPDADLKVFLTATVAERACRRAKDLEQRGFAVPPLTELEAQIAERDRQDSSRAMAPLQMASDAVEVVTDGMDIGAVIQALVDLFRQRVPEDAWPGPSGS